jgi:hypothetical protein
MVPVLHDRHMHRRHMFVYAGWQVHAVALPLPSGARRSVT